MVLAFSDAWRAAFSQLFKRVCPLRRKACGRAGDLYGRVAATTTATLEHGSPLTKAIERLVFQNDLVVLLSKSEINDGDYDDGGNRHALEAELSGDYESALEIYRKLMDRYDTRYEVEEDLDSQRSARGMEREKSGAGGEEGEHQAHAYSKVFVSACKSLLVGTLSCARLEPDLGVISFFKNQKTKIQQHAV